MNIKTWYYISIVNQRAKPKGKRKMNIDNFEDRTAELENTEAHLHRKIRETEDYSSRLDDVLTMIANTLDVLIKEREIQLSNLSEHHGDFVGSFATLVARVDELENTSSGMAVMKLQDSIDETQESCGNHEERLDELQSHIEELEVDIAEIDRRLDDATITI